MSYHITVSITCDGCGASISAAPEHRVSVVGQAILDAKIIALSARWISVGHQTKAHYCRDCSDKPQPPLPKKTRPPLHFNLDLLHQYHEF